MITVSSVVNCFFQVESKNLSSHHGDHGGHGETAQAHKIQAHPKGDIPLFRNAWFFLRDHRVLRGELLFPG
jgi:hypothetical protein